MTDEQSAEIVAPLGVPEQVTSGLLPSTVTVGGGEPSVSEMASALFAVPPAGRSIRFTDSLFVRMVPSTENPWPATAPTSALAGRSCPIAKTAIATRAPNTTPKPSLSAALFVLRVPVSRCAIGVTSRLTASQRHGVAELQRLKCLQRVISVGAGKAEAPRGTSLPTSPNSANPLSN
jgi:hypothetical protein